MRPLRLLCFALLLSTLPAPAEAIFDFSTLPEDTAVPFTLTSNGLSASFGSYNNFVVMPSSFSFPGSVLQDFNVNGNFLYIDFSRQISSLSFNYATGTGESTLVVQLFLDGNSAPPIQQTFTAHPVPTGGAEGHVNLTGNFDGVAIANPFLDACPMLGQPGCEAESFAIGTLYVDAASTPEPTSLLLVGTGLLGALHTVRRRFTAPSTL